MTAVRKQIIGATLVAVTGVGMIAFAQNGPNTTDTPAAVADNATVTGSVVGMNLSGDGEPNGLLVKTGDGPLTQLNFPPHMADPIGKAITAGTKITAQTRPLGPPPRRPGGPGPMGGPGDGPDAGPGAGGPAKHGPRSDRPAPPPPAPADHPVFELVSVTPEGGAELKVLTPDELPTQHVDGKVARLNYNREGRVDGAVLEDGTLIHVGPKEAEDLNLAVGQQLSVDGTKPPRAGDNKVLHATKVNDTAIERPKPPAPGRPRPGM